MRKFGNVHKVEGKGEREKEKRENPRRKNGLCQGTEELLWALIEVDGPVTKFGLHVEHDDAIHTPSGIIFIMCLTSLGRTAHAYCTGLKWQREQGKETGLGFYRGSDLGPG